MQPAQHQDESRQPTRSPNAAATHQTERAPVTAPKENAVQDAISHPYCIALQPICDASMRHVADELLYRSGAGETRAQISDDSIATARVCHIAFYELGLRQLVGPRKLFFNAPRQWLLEPALLPPHPEQAIIEVLESVTGDPDVLASLRKIRTLGYDIALDDFTLTQDTRPLLEVASIVKVDIQRPYRMQDIGLYRSMGLKLLAEKVETRDELQRFQDLGFDYFQGYFYAKPETHKDSAHARANNRSALLRILATLQQPEVNYRQLERLIAQDPHLAFILLKYTNTVLFRRFSEMTTIRQALNALGVERVRTIVMTALLANNGPASRLALPHALLRAAMCEHLGSQWGDVDPSTAFMMGLMSMMDTLIGMPLQDILAQIPVSQEVKDALLLRSQRLGSLLAQIEHFETADTKGWDTAQFRQFNRAWMESQAWTTSVLSAVDQ